MRDAARLSDHDHPLVQRTAKRLAEGRETDLAKLQALFQFVRDQVPFGFPARPSEWDRVSASRVMELGRGYCNTKATLLVALCRAVGIPARVHFGRIQADIMWGIFPSTAVSFMPRVVPHSWTEVYLDGAWKPIDAYINDKAFFQAARARLERSGRSVGYSLACVDGRCSCAFSFGEKGFVQMGAVVEDHGAWEDASAYFATDLYVGLTAWQQGVYPLLAWIGNRNVERIRSSAP
jgi:hypothetical protein